MRNFTAADFAAYRGAATHSPATGVNPSGFTPAGSAPANLAALKAHPVVGDNGTAKPSAAWAPNQNVGLGDGSRARWDGTTWVVWVAPPALTGVVVTPDTGALATTTGTLQLTVDAIPTGAPLGTVVWSSSATGVATVSNTGLVTGVAAGTATITAQAGSFSDTCAITVPAPPAPPAPTGGTGGTGGTGS
jgi:hypothetical protein